MEFNAENAENAERNRWVQFVAPRPSRTPRLTVWPHPHDPRHPRENRLRVQERFAGCPDRCGKYVRLQPRRIGFGPDLSFAETYACNVP